MIPTAICPMMPARRIFAESHSARERNKKKETTIRIWTTAVRRLKKYHKGLGKRTGWFVILEKSAGHVQFCADCFEGRVLEWKIAGRIRYAEKTFPTKARLTTISRSTQQLYIFSS